MAELKKLNHIHTDIELHARRVIKIPSKGILINLDSNISSESSHPPLMNTEEIEEDTNGFTYLNNLDTAVKEIKEKAEQAAVNSTVLVGSETVKIQGISFCDMAFEE